MQTTHIRPLAVVGIGIGVLLLVGCATAPVPTTPVAPTPPQITVAKAIDALAQAVDGTVTAAIEARNQGKVSQEDVRTIEALCKAIALWGKSADAELRSTDLWDAQRIKIAQSAGSVGIAQLKARVSPSAQALITVLVAAVNQITGIVGGPTL